MRPYPRVIIPLICSLTLNYCNSSQSKAPVNSGTGDNPTHITNTVPTGSIRTLDTLACVAADKQVSILTFLMYN